MKKLIVIIMAIVCSNTILARQYDVSECSPMMSKVAKKVTDDIAIFQKATRERDPAKRREGLKGLQSERAKSVINLADTYDEPYCGENVTESCWLLDAISQALALDLYEGLLEAKAIENGGVWKLGPFRLGMTYKELSDADIVEGEKFSVYTPRSTFDVPAYKLKKPLLGFTGVVLNEGDSINRDDACPIKKFYFVKEVEFDEREKGLKDVGEGLEKKFKDVINRGKAKGIWDNCLYDWGFNQTVCHIPFETPEIEALDVKVKKTKDEWRLRLPQKEIAKLVSMCVEGYGIKHFGYNISIESNMLLGWYWRNLKMCQVLVLEGIPVSLKSEQDAFDAMLKARQQENEQKKKDKAAIEGAFDDL